MSLLEALEKRLGISFRNGDLLRLAFVHKSYLNENPGLTDSNERLEFLGDALIGLVVAQELYLRLPHGPEGELTAIRSAMVRGESLAATAEALGLGECLLMGKGEEAAAGRSRPSNLAGVFEALAGALFLDGGFDSARSFVLRTLLPQLRSLEQRNVPKSPKSLLQELLQGRGMGLPSYRIVEATGEVHSREFTAEVSVSGRVMGRGSGRRKARAEEAAAKEAVRALAHDE